MASEPTNTGVVAVSPPKIAGMCVLCVWMSGDRLVSLKFKQNSMDCKCTKLDWPTGPRRMLSGSHQFPDLLGVCLSVSGNKYRREDNETEMGEGTLCRPRLVVREELCELFHSCTILIYDHLRFFMLPRLGDCIRIRVTTSDISHNKASRGDILLLALTYHYSIFYININKSQGIATD